MRRIPGFWLVLVTAMLITTTTSFAQDAPPANEAAEPAAPEAAEPAAAEPAAAETEARAGTVEAADGVTISYEVLGEGDPALVFVHCWACNRSFWREQAEVFAADHTVVLLDLPGHGESGRDRETWTLDSLGADVATVVDTLGLEHVVLVGHSMGGPVSLLAAPRLGERLDGIVCVDTLHDADYEIPQEAMDQWMAAMAQDYEGMMRVGVMGMMPDADEALREWVIAQGLEADQAAMQALVGQFTTFDAPAAFSAANAPIRCINAEPYSEQAPVTDLEGNAQLADFGAVLMSGVGHYLQLERPAEFNEHMRAMLDEIAAAGSTAE